MSIRESAKLFAKIVRKENKAIEEMVKLNPSFNKARSELLFIIGRF